MSTDQNKQLNNCDGCKRGLSIEDGIHYYISDKGNKFYDIGCTKSNYEEKCYSCGGKGTYSQMHGVHGAEDFGGDGFDEKPSIHNYPCKACNGTGFKPKSNYEGEEKCKICGCGKKHHSTVHGCFNCGKCSLPPQDWKEKEREAYYESGVHNDYYRNENADYWLERMALQEKEAHERGQQEERKFILNILDGIDRADKEMGNKYGGTNAIRFALQSRFIGKMSLSPEEEK